MEHILCRDCPCWRQYYKDDWSPIFCEKLSPTDGKPLIDSMGNAVLVRNREGEPVMWGACAAKLPEFGPNTQTHVTMRSDWWCESKEKHEALTRMRRTSATNGREISDLEKADQKWSSTISE